MSAVPARTVRFHEYGEPADVLVEEHAEVQEPPTGRVRVRVLAVALNPADWELCRGFAAGGLPRGIGLDVAGVVDAIGAGVTRLAIGDVVFGAADFTQPSAGLADVAILSDWAVVPEGLDPVQASGLRMATQTAVWTLDAMGVGEGTTLVVHGAGGSVGFAAVQVARLRGARVVATSGSTYAPALEASGASVTPYGDGVTDRVRALAGGPVDLVLDAAPAGSSFETGLLALTDDPQRVVTISHHAAAKAAGARVNLEMLGSPVPLRELLTTYGTLAAEGGYTVPIGRTLPFARWREAVDLSLSGHPRGKVVVLVGA